jgi:hypothetical protein
MIFLLMEKMIPKPVGYYKDLVKSAVNIRICQRREKTWKKGDLF